MSQQSKHPKVFYSKRHQRNPAASASSQNPYHLGYEPQQYVTPHGLNCAPHLPMPNANPNSSTYYPIPFPNPQPFPYFESVNRAENCELKAHDLSLENVFRKFENDFQILSPTLGETQKSRKTKQNKHTTPTLTSLASLDSPLNQRGLNNPMRLMSPPPPHHLSRVKKCQESSKISEFSRLPVESKNSHRKPKSNKKKSSMSFENNTKDQESSAKSPVEALVSDAKKLEGEKGHGGGNIHLKGQQSPKNKGQPKHSKKPFCKSNHSASFNDLTLGRNSCPKSQLKLIVPSQGDLKKDGETSKVWNLYVIINEDIDITLKLSSYLNERLKYKIKFEVKSVTKDKPTGYVRFLLEFKSKHQMNMAIRFFNASNKKNAIKIDCKRVAEDNHLQDKPNTLEDKLKCQNDVQQQHEKKIESVREEITSLLCSVEDTFSAQEAISNRVKALEHKERELLFQLAEYRNAQNDLEMQLKKLQKVQKKDSVEEEEVLKKLGQEQKFLSKALPLYAIRTKITETVLKNKVIILMGNCGSGKSTQLVQYLMETSLVNDGPIVCTEPSEKQALSMAKHVAAEVNSSLGNLVGFSSENNIHLSIHTNVLFMSEHELLEQFHKIKSFSAYSCIIIDEAQERTVYADLLLGLLKIELSKIPRLRIIIITAPAEISIYQSFFTDSVLLEVNACLFPVQVIWSNLGQEDQAQLFKKSAVEKALAVHCTEDEGDILVFVASVTEVLECCTDFKSCLKEDNYVCLPLHSGLNYEQLKGIYRPLSLGKRKIIFTTYCTEVMNAVPNVRYVIDTGVKKERFLESGNKNELPISFITQESAKRRKERAGSSSVGKCYRLYSSNDFKAMKATQPDEMCLAGSIEKAVMNLIKQEINPMKFEFPTSVLGERISRAIRNLESLGAVLNDNGKYKMTDLGTRMSKLPFRFQITWVLLEGIKQGMVMESVALTSLSDLKQEVFCIEAKNNEIMQIKHQQFGQPCESIALRTLRVLKAWFQQPDKEKHSWCAEHFLNISSIKLITSHMKSLCKTLATNLEMNVKFSQMLSINNANDLEKLVDEALTKFNSSLEEKN